MEELLKKYILSEKYFEDVKIEGYQIYGAICVVNYSTGEYLEDKMEINIWEMLEFISKQIYSKVN